MVAIAPRVTFKAWSAIVLAPSLSLGAGVDYFPGNASVGLGLAARFRVAGRPYDDSIFGAGFLTLQAGVSVR